MPSLLPDVPLPGLDDPLFAEFWRGTAGGTLRVQGCGACGAVRWPPRHLCSACGSFETTWQDAAPRGVLFSWVVVGRATAPGYGEVPYGVGLVALDEHPHVRVLGHVVAADLPALRDGLRMRADFVPAGPNGEFHIVRWVPDEPGGGDGRQGD